MITVDDIGISFGGLKAIDSVSLVIPTGSITGLIGPNGAGKTTLFNIIAGFLRPDRGRVMLDGADVTGLAPHRLFHRGLMRTFQIPQLFDRMTVTENLMAVPAGQTGERLSQIWLAGAHIRRQDDAVRERALEALGFLGLSHLADEIAANLSGGQKKLLELGRALMSECTTILLDEPAAGVNRTLLTDLARDIRRLNREFGKTFCVIEHDMDLVAQLCDPVIVMAEGRIIAKGGFDEIHADPLVLQAYLGSGVARNIGTGAS